MKSLLFIVLVFSISVLKGQNLIVNPGAEVEPLTLGWTQVLGNWQSGTEVTPHGGAKHFYAGGNSGNGSQLIQDVDVSAYASNIDAGISTFTFVAWMRVFDFSMGNFNDRGRAIVEYRNAASTVLSTYDTGNRNNLSWTSYTDSRLAPAGTRTIRIRLMADRLVGSDADGYFDDLSLVQSLPMPVDLLSFYTLTEGNAIALHWQTASEENNDFFVVEKSMDGMNWTTIDRQEGWLISQQLSTYSFIDEQPVEGLQYYRLKQIDVSGSSTTYPVVAHQFSEDQRELILYPNPSEGQVVVYVSGVGPKTVMVWSMSGEQAVSPVMFEGNEYVIAAEDLAAGYYVVEVLSETVVLRKTLVRY